ncbi:MAG: rplX [Gammaproteobacteria bacterium]|jgi:large subunit ribosomal protein L24|nr:rplX [Gammaproteobacteria bacterium]MCE3239221.1 rplX [Gammaproteobacteria bacterium]
MRKIKKGDEVIVITGKDKGRRGIVLSVLLGGKKLLVEGINTVKKHVKPNPNTREEGGIIIKTQPIDRSNVMLFDSVSGKGRRVCIQIQKDGKKVRCFKANALNPLTEVIDV